MISAAPSTTTTTDATTRVSAVTSRCADVITRLIESSTIGVMSGAISMAPITTPTLSRTRPKVAMPMASSSSSQ